MLRPAARRRGRSHGGTRVELAQDLGTPVSLLTFGSQRWKEYSLTADNEVAWLFELELKPENRARFEALVPEMVASTREEEGARAYQLFRNDETDTVVVYERYADSAAALTHMTIFGEKFGARFMELVTPRRFTVLGAPGEDLVGALTPIGAVIHVPMDGFA
jgi:quinol monooxygenase YgiN